MIWFSHKQYTPEFYAVRLAEICHHARCSTRTMTLVAGLAVLVMTVADMGVIYAL